MKRIKLNPINLFFHYFVSILLLVTGGSFIYKALIESFPKEMPFEKDNLLLIGIIFIVTGIFTVNREFRKLEFYQVSLNGFDSREAASIIVAILKTNGWYINKHGSERIIASGANYDNNTYKFLSAPKQLTIIIVDDTLLLNCLVEPPRSNQVTFGNTKRIVTKLVDEFLSKTS
jgi:hypothetical protein